MGARPLSRVDFMLWVRGVTTSISAFIFFPTLSLRVLNPCLQYFEANSEASAKETVGTCT
jgi:hypothetical protein